MLDLQQLKKGLLLLMVMLVFISGAFYLIERRQKEEIPAIKNGAQLPLFDVVDSKDITDHPLIMVNFFASWCEGCALEHDKLLTLAKENNIFLVGIVFQDNEDKIDQFLKERGNPYDKIIYDIEGKYAVNWGIYGVPESYFLDHSATLLYRHQGVLFGHHVKNQIMPLVEKTLTSWEVKS